MRKLFLFSALLSALVFTSVALQCQQLTIQTDSGKQVVLSRTDLEALPHVKVTASEHSSGPVNFEGATLKSVRRVQFHMDEWVCHNFSVLEVTLSAVTRYFESNN